MSEYQAGPSSLIRGGRQDRGGGGGGGGVAAGDGR